MEKTTKQKINKEIQIMDNTINLLDLTDLYRTVHPTRVEYTFFSSVHETFSRLDYILYN